MTTTAERIRLTCPCGHAARTALWCGDPACCPQDLVTLLAALAAEQERDGLPVYAVRVSEDGQSARVWSPGGIAPVFAGPIREAQQLVMRHACTGGLEADR